VGSGGCSGRDKSIAQVQITHTRQSPQKATSWFYRLHAHNVAGAESLNQLT